LKIPSFQMTDDEHGSLNSPPQSPDQNEAPAISPEPPVPELARMTEVQLCLCRHYHVEVMRASCEKAIAAFLADRSVMKDEGYLRAAGRFGELLTDFLVCIDSDVQDPLDMDALSSIFRDLARVHLTIAKFRVDPGRNERPADRLGRWMLMLRELSESCFCQSDRLSSNMEKLRTALNSLSHAPKSLKSFKGRKVAGLDAFRTFLKGTRAAFADIAALLLGD
jgi:hypothetical protein